MSDAPSALLVTSAGASRVAVTPVLAALEATGLKVRAIDAGRVGSRKENTVERIFRAVVGEFAERRLEKELNSNPPDVAVSFDPNTTTALTVARDQAKQPAPVVAVVTDLVPTDNWSATDADRYLAVDDEAAVALSELGVESDRIVVVGPVCEYAFAEVSRHSRASLRRRFNVPPGPAIVVEVGGYGYETTSSIAMQLSLTGPEGATYLFDAGSDQDAAMALRSKVPALDMRAKLFGATSENAPGLWRCADVVIARPTAETVMRALMLGTKMISLMLEGNEGDEHLARALEARGIGAIATNALLLSSALDPLLASGERSDKRTASDGAGNAADIAWVVGSQRRDVLEERRAAARNETRERVREATKAAAAHARVAAAPGELEDLSGGFSPPPVSDIPDEGEITRLRAEVSTRMKQVSKTVFESRETAEQWEKREELAKKKGDDDLARQARRKAETERHRMHAALKEMSALEKELADLEQAARDAAAAPRPHVDDTPPPRRTRSTSRPRPSRSSIDDMLADMKRQTGQGSGGGGTSTANPGKKKRRSKKRSAETVDDELAALKRKMAKKRK